MIHSANATMRSTLAALAVVTAVPAAMAQDKDFFKSMQIGPAWCNTFAATLKGKQDPAAVKGILLDLGGDTRALFDTETLRVISAYKGNVKWGGTPWTGEHGKVIAIANDGDKAFFNPPAGPGWADASGHFTDKRDKELHGWGNLDYAKFKGYFRSGKKIILAYEVQGTPVYQSLEALPDGVAVQYQVAAHKGSLSFVVADADDASTVAQDKVGLKNSVTLGVGPATGSKGPSFDKDGGLVVAKLSASGTPTSFTLFYTKSTEMPTTAPVDLAALVKGGEGLWKDTITTSGTISTDKKAPWVTDTMGLPTSNPWHADLRFSGFDFIDEDTAAVCTWNGDVWTVSGLKGDWSKLNWRRFASGLFEPLGLKVVDGTVYVHGRDQITKLIDLNKDGEADRYESFFRDEPVSPNFHEFAFELQTDKEGNFYTCKASPVRGGGRGFDTIYPSHGTVLKISKDGTKSQIIATGLRAPGGLAVGPNGEITTGENEGTWQPCCKLNYFTPKDYKDGPVFLGTEDSKHDAKGSMHEPLCYFPMSVDNSGSSQVWVPEGADFGLKAGELIHCSYGQSTLYRVLPDPVDNTMQGGVVKLPIALGSSAMRPRFAKDGSLYICGLRGWQTNAANETAFQRIRYNKGVEDSLPNKVEFTKTGVRITFGKSISPETAKDPESYSAERWKYMRTKQYGSGEFSVDNPDRAAEKQAEDKPSKDEYRKHDTVKITAARPSKDGKSVELDLEGHKPSDTLKFTWDLEDSGGAAIKGEYYGTYRKAGK